MAIQVASFIIPRNGALWYVLEDKFIKGGMQCVPDEAARDTIPEENRKAGQLVIIQSDKSLWQLQNDLTTWTNLQIGGVEGPQGDTGNTGETGPSVYDVWLEAGNSGTEEEFFETLRGLQGETGAQGEIGETGPSAYQSWLDLGNVGNEEEFLATLQGPSAYEVWAQSHEGTEEEFFEAITGKSSYQFWLDEGNEGTLEDFLQTNAGKSAYDVWADLGNEGDEQDFIDSLKGADGNSLQIQAAGPLSELSSHIGEEYGFVFLDTDNNNIYVKTSLGSPYWSDPIPFVEGIPGETGAQGEIGATGKSLYQSWLDIGNEGTEPEFVEAMRGTQGEQGEKGDTGEQGEQGLQGQPGEPGLQGADGEQGIQGPKGDDGEQGERGEKGDTGNNGLDGNEGERGETGPQGADGKSAYQVWLDAGNSGSQAAYLNSLKGEQGIQGPKGDDGEKGDTGEQGERGEQGEQGPAGTIPALVLPYDLSFFVPGSMPVGDEVVGAFVCTRAVALSANMPGSLARVVGVAPNAQCIYKLMIGATQIGTITFASGATNGTFASADRTLSIGDVLTLVTPSVPNSAIRDVVITLAGRASAPQLSMTF